MEETEPSVDREGSTPLLSLSPGAQREQLPTQNTPTTTRVAASTTRRSTGGFEQSLLPRFRRSTSRTNFLDIKPRLSSQSAGNGTPPILSSEDGETGDDDQGDFEQGIDPTLFSDPSKLVSSPTEGEKGGDTRLPRSSRSGWAKVRAHVLKRNRKSQVFPESESLRVKGDSRVDLLHRMQDDRDPKFFLDPSGDRYTLWLALVTAAILYNFWSIIFRTAFLSDGHLAFWLPWDYISDAVFGLDIFVQLRTGFLFQGVLIRSPVALKKKYFENRYWILDVMCIIPIEVLLLPLGYYAACRMNRLLKINRWLLFQQKLLNRSNHSNVFRMVFMLHLLLLIIHWVGCFYYLISSYEGLGVNPWVSPASAISNQTCNGCVNSDFVHITRKYLHAMHWSSMTISTIGNRPDPHTDLEYYFIIVCIIVGVIVFASLVGQVGVIISQINESSTHYHDIMDRTKTYMHRQSIPKDIQDRVKRWYDYSWNTYKSIDDNDVLEHLPTKLHGDLALMAHIKILKRIRLFGDCDEVILRELALSLRKRIYSPGEYICRKNEIGREMYLIHSGFIEILDDTKEREIVFSVLEAGQYFGEIALLNLGASGNKRTASARSIGFSEVYVLDKMALSDVLQIDPSLRWSLATRATQLLDPERKN